MQEHTKRQVKDDFKKDAFISDVCHRCLCVISYQTEMAKKKSNYHLCKNLFKLNFKIKGSYSWAFTVAHPMHKIPMYGTG